MSEVNECQQPGTPTWVDLRVPDVAAARDYYARVFGWAYEDSELGTVCLLRGLPVAGMRAGDDRAWRVHLATDDCDATVEAVLAAGGAVTEEPHDVGGLGRAATVVDPVGAVVGLWQGRAFPGCRLVNEPDTLVRNDLVTGEPAPARAFYAAVFGFTLDGNPDVDFDFTFLRRPDGHEIGGVMGLPGAPSAWNTTFEVADTDATLARAGAAVTPDDTIYGRSATFRDPFGVELTIIARP